MSKLLHIQSKYVYLCNLCIDPLTQSIEILDCFPHYSVAINPVQIYTIEVKHFYPPVPSQSAYPRLMLAHRDFFILGE